MASLLQVETVPSSSSTKGKRTSMVSTIDCIILAINTAKHNKSHVQKMLVIIKQILKALNGADYTFIRRAEFYSDLKETLNKLYIHVIESTGRKRWVKYMMAKRDHQFLLQMQEHVDVLCGRIMLSFASRVEQRKYVASLHMPCSTRSM